MSIMRPEDHRHRKSTAEGWPIGITSYRLANRWICHVDNVSPGAIVARGEGETREEAESTALALASKRLKSTRRLKDTLSTLRASVDSMDKSLRKEG